LTLLVTVAGSDFVLLSSDLRITAARRDRVEIIDERFNKCILFAREDFNGGLTFTGLAQWSIGSRKVRLHDLIAEVLQQAEADEKLSRVVIRLIDAINAAQRTPALRKHDVQVELHLAGYHVKLDVPIIVVVSNLRTDRPWSASTPEHEWQHTYDGFQVFTKVFGDETDVIFGGADSVVPVASRQIIRKAVAGGADAFDVARLARAIVEAAASRTLLIGKDAVSLETALIDLINQKRAGKPIIAKERPRGENVVDLMDALRKSIGGAKAVEDSKPAKKARKVASGQKEMLMPIAGKKPGKEAAAKKPASKPQRKSA